MCLKRGPVIEWPVCSGASSRLADMTSSHQIIIISYSKSVLVLFKALPLYFIFLRYTMKGYLRAG